MVDALEAALVVDPALGEGAGVFEHAPLVDGAVVPGHDAEAQHRLALLPCGAPGSRSRTGANGYHWSSQSNCLSDSSPPTPDGDGEADSSPATSETRDDSAARRHRRAGARRAADGLVLVAEVRSGSEKGRVRGFMACRWSDPAAADGEGRGM